jgi:hypothetical protein
VLEVLVGETPLRLSGFEPKAQCFTVFGWIRTSGIVGDVS